MHTHAHAHTPVKIYISMSYQMKSKTVQVLSIKKKHHYWEVLLFYCSVLINNLI